MTSTCGGSGGHREEMSEKVDSFQVFGYHSKKSREAFPQTCRPRLLVICAMGAPALNPTPMPAIPPIHFAAG